MGLLNFKSNLQELASIFSDFTKLFFPEVCLGCSLGLVKGEEILCTSCLVRLPLEPYFKENPVEERFVGRLPLTYAWALMRFRKSGIVQHLLHQLKYNNHPEVAVRLGKIAGEQIKNRRYSNIDFIVPIPLHQSRLRNRGYNQSSKFAEGIALSINSVINETICVRTENTKTQTKKTRDERWENVENAFRVVDPQQIKGKKILLVDDVITTGATLEACGQKLLKAGCAELSIVCIAEAQ